MRYTSITIIILAFLMLSSCATKKEIWYLQDAKQYNNSEVSYGSTKIQPNDILKITVGALVSEAAIPFNKTSGEQSGGTSLELMQLNGYLVTTENTIDFPQLGTVSTKDKTVLQLQDEIKGLLVDNDLLNNPTVNVRILNAKVTVLGEINAPGTYNFTEQNITIFQALGYAGDLTINGQREDVKIIREVDGNRRVATVDLTSAEVMDSDFYHIKPNDVIVVNQNGPKVKSAGFIGNLGTLLSVFSILLSTVVLITR